MSFLILHDDENQVRGAAITAVSTEPNSSVECLQDGMLALPWHGSQVLSHTIEMQRASAVALSLVAVFDPRGWEQGGPSGGTVVLQVFKGGVWTAPSGWQRRGNVALGAIWWSGPAETVTAWRVVFAALDPFALSVGELVAGNPIPFAGGPRELVADADPGVVANGPWRTQVATPRRVRELHFPALLSDYVGAQLERSVGSLLPVALVPRLDGQLILHGHLAEVGPRRLNSAHHWHGQVLRFIESERPL